MVDLARSQLEDIETAELVRTVDNRLDQVRANLMQLIISVRRLSRHFSELKARRPRVVKVHPRDPLRRPIKRRRGRPKGSRTRVLHVMACGDAEARALAVCKNERL